MVAVDMDDLNYIVEMTTEYMKEYIDTIDPNKYKENARSFVDLALSGPVIIVSTFIDKLSKMTTLSQDELSDIFNMQLIMLLESLNSRNKKND